MTDMPPPPPGSQPPAPPPPPGPGFTSVPKVAREEHDAPEAGSGEHRFPCHTCGADLRYKPGTDTLVCDHCGALEPIPGGSGEAKRELDYETAMRDELAPSEMEEIRTTRCPNCGAQVEFSGADHAAECPFCATPVVLDTGSHRQIKPRGVLPFGLGETEARKQLTDWLGRLWFAPNGVQEYARKGRAMDGIYVPYWTFDADTESDYTGERGDEYYTTRTVMRNGKSETERVRHVRWTPKRGRVARFFNDVLVIASRSMPKKYADRLDPWDLEALVDYRPEYLAGFRAEGYTVELDDGMVEAKAYMDQVIRQDVRQDIGGDEQRIHSVDTLFRDVTFKHVLLPVYLAAYKYSGKSYQFVVNARTGEVQGERPYSAIKIALASIAAAIVAGIAIYLWSKTR